MKVELAGLDGNGGPCYIGTGSFHRRESLCGQKYGREWKAEWKRRNNKKVEHHAALLTDTCKILASCTYEENTEWGKEVGCKYGCPVEDIITGLSIQCRGWRSIYPERNGFLGVAPTTLLRSLVQHKRWCEGDFQIFLSRYCPLIYGHGRIPLKLQLSYCYYLLWAPNSLPTLYYVAVPSLCLLKDISLFAKMSDPWVIPFAYAFFANCTYSLDEFIWCGGTFQAWWNYQRMWVIQRTTSYFFGSFDNILRSVGFAKSSFAITSKIADEEMSIRHKQEVMEFRATSPMFSIIATLALINLFSFVVGIKRVIMDVQTKVSNKFG